MAVITVRHKVSNVITEIEDIHLAHPVLGPLYEVVRTNDAGKPYVLETGDQEDPEVGEPVEFPVEDAEKPKPSDKKATR